MISFITLFSRLRMLVNINSWCEATSLILNVSMGSLAFYLTKCLRFILYSFLLLIITSFCCYLRYIYENNLYLMAFLSLRVDSINIKGNFLQFVNPGPDPDYSNIFSFCHWNLNSVAAELK